MKLLAILCVVAIAAVSSLPRDKVELLRNEIENKGNGYHRYSFLQSDGTQQEQKGELRNAGIDNEFYAVKGSFSWVGPDNTNYTVNYVADEKGFQPEIHEIFTPFFDYGPYFGSALVASCLGK